MTDDRPEPKYGQYAPIPPTPVAEPLEATPVGHAPAAPEAPGVPVRERRTWDVVLTTFLLLIGVYDVVSGFARFADLGAALRDAYTAQGIEGFTSDALAASVGMVINVVRIVLLVVAVAWSLRRISRRRLSFWVPLALAAVAAIVVTVCVFVVVLNDPALAQYVADQASTQ